MTRTCAECGASLPTAKRSDARFCGPRCQARSGNRRRTALNRLGAAVASLTTPA